ncbi:cytochrome P450 [Aspergillus cavernicola]|uniref:Cytochrome P450 n=1 Tax=Aspergillus cavernicola TaxID=176166 RepID=A0ABR4INW0_9EURO
MIWSWPLISGIVIATITPTLLYKALQFGRNVQHARRSGLPYTFSPIHELELWAFLTNAVLRWMYAGYLMQEKGWPRWARFMIKDWMYEDRGRAHVEYGEVFLVVSPGGVVCYIASADVAMGVCARRKVFVKPPEKMKMLEPFGPNVVSTDGDIWRAHIRVTLPSFGEGVHRLVWSETMRQSQMLTSAWLAHDSRELKTDIYNLTCNVMSCVAFGQPAEWTAEANAKSQNHRLSLVQAIMGVVNNLGAILLLPPWLLQWTRESVYTAYSEFEQYMNELLNKEQKRMTSHPDSEGGVAKGNLLTAVLKSNAEAPAGDNEPLPSRSKAGFHLTDEEVKGNVFIFLLAGYDTTANTILYSSIVLVLYPDIQNQIIEEVHRVYVEAARAGRSELTYEDDLPKFRYLLAFMYEVMRVFPIVIPITRMAATEQPLAVSGSQHPLASDTMIIINNTAIHHSDSHWVKPHIIEPRRWLTNHPNEYDPEAPTPDQEDEIRLGTASIPCHKRGTFMTFNEGPRSCLGRRFAMIEFVAFFSRLLKQGRLGLKGDMTPSEVERQVRLRAGGSPVTLIPPCDVKVCLSVE